MLLNSWNYISSIGVNKNYDDSLIKRIKLTNQFSVIAILIFLFSGINNFLLGDVFSALIIEGFVLICFFGFFLNKQSYHRFAISFLFTSVSVAIFYFDSYSGFLSGSYLYYFPLILAIAFVFDLRENKVIVCYHLTLIMIFLITNLLTKHQLFKSDYLTDENRAQMFIFNLLFSASSVGFFIYLTMQNNYIQTELYRKRIIERDLSELKIKEALAEKNILLAELHHRVKNNLAIISGLFSLKINDELHIDAKNVLIESKNRVRSMALIHNMLYKSHDLRHINFDGYIKELIIEINSSYPTISNNVKITTEVNNIVLDVNTAVPCGLILNELLSNCYKHAFNNIDNGHINILFTNENQNFKMIVKDNGIGLPSDYNKKQSLGITVIESLCEQLDGTSKFESNQGTNFEFIFKSKSI